MHIYYSFVQIYSTGGLYTSLLCQITPVSFWIHTSRADFINVSVPKGADFGKKMKVNTSKMLLGGYLEKKTRLYWKDIKWVSITLNLHLRIWVDVFF